MKCQRDYSRHAGLADRLDWNILTSFVFSKERTSVHQQAGKQTESRALHRPIYRYNPSLWAKAQQGSRKKKDSCTMSTFIYIQSYLQISATMRYELWR